MSSPLKNGTLIALTAASLFASACSKAKDGGGSAASGASGDQAAKIHCQGVNECKGKGTCKTDKNSCAGANECKGKGVVDGLTADQCTTKGGTIVAGM